MRTAVRDQPNDDFEPAVTSTTEDIPSIAGPSRLAPVPNLLPKSRKALRKTPSWPVITDFTISPRQKSLPSPIPPSSGKKRKAASIANTNEAKRRAVKNILTTISEDERKEAAKKEESIMLQDASITKAKATLDQSAIAFLSENLPDNQQLQDPPGKFDTSMTTPEISPPSSDREPDRSQPPQPEEHIAFNIQNAEMHRAPRPRRGPPTPEHVLLVVEDDDVISKVLYFFQSHDPLDILEAYWNQSLDYVVPDEGIETTAEITPPAPLPTPTSSTEAVNGSAETKTEVETPPQSNHNDTDSSVEITDIIISANVTIDISNDKDDLEDKGEGEGGESTEGHAN